MGSSDGVVLITTTRQSSIVHTVTTMTEASSRTTTDREFFTTPYKMRKFSEDVTVMVDLSSSVVTRPPSLTTGGSSRVATDPVCAPLSPNENIASPYSQSSSSPTQPSQQGIPIPDILQPLFGLEFVPFVLPHDTTTFNSVTVFGGGGREALTDKLLEDLDVGCPSSYYYDFYTASTTDPQGTAAAASTSPLPASTTTTMTTIKSLDGLDEDSTTSNLLLANLLNDNDEPDDTTTPALRSKPPSREEPLRNGNTKDSMTTAATRQTQSQQPQNSNNTWAPTSKRRRNVFQRRRAWSFGVDNNNSSSTEMNNAVNGINVSSGKPPPMPGARRKLGLRFIHTKKTTTPTSSTRSSKGTADSSSSSPSRSRADTDPSDWDEPQQQQQQSLLPDHHQSTLQEVQEEAVAMQQHANEIERRVKTLQNEIGQLQSALTQSNGKQQQQQQQQQQQLQPDVVDNRNEARAKMKRLQLAALEASQAVTDSIQQMMMKNDASNDPSSVEFQPPSRRPRAMTAPVTATSDALLDANDMPLDLERAASNEASSTASTTSTLLNLDTLPSPTGFVFVDRNNLKSILQNLDQLGYDVATDESDRFVPTRDTEKALQRYQKNVQLQNDSRTDWPIQPWYSAHHDDILIWTGDVQHAGLGSDWPVCKARGLIQTSPRALLEYLMDSSKVKEYNKMSQGRDDMYVIQKGLDTAASSSPYDISGECKIVKSVNKPRFLPFTIEMISLMHGKPLETAPGSYMMVYRSVFEDTSTLGDTAPVIRSEMLLGVVLARPYNEDHSITEMTSITHFYSPGVPEMIARRAAPSSALNVLRDLQSIFK